VNDPNLPPFSPIGPQYRSEDGSVYYASRGYPAQWGYPNDMGQPIMYTRVHPAEDARGYRTYYNPMDTTAAPYSYSAAPPDRSNGSDSATGTRQPQTASDSRASDSAGQSPASADYCSASEGRSEKNNSTSNGGPPPHDGTQTSWEHSDYLSATESPVPAAGASHQTSSVSSDYLTATETSPGLKTSNPSSLDSKTESPGIEHAPTRPSTLPGGGSKPPFDSPATLGTMTSSDLQTHTLTNTFLAQQITLQQQQMKVFENLVSKSHNNDTFRTKPDTFDGSSDCEWADYLAHFEEVARSNEWNEKKKASVLATRLKDEAMRAWRTKYPNTPASSSYDLLVATMNERFNPAGMIEAHKAELQARLKKKTESFMDWACGLRRLALKAYPAMPNQTRDELIKDHFIRNLVDPNMRTTVTMAHPKTVEDAVSLATEYETVSGNNAPRKPMVAPVTTPAQPEDSLVDQVASEVWKKMQASRADRKKMVCYYCNQPGHFQRDCPSRPRGRGAGRGRGGQNPQGSAQQQPAWPNNAGPPPTGAAAGTGNGQPLPAIYGTTYGNPTITPGNGAASSN